MCTVSWLHDSEGYQLFCNRDEQHSRQPARAPRQHELRGVRFVAPVDPEGGGSWIGVNQFGLALCLLNGHACAKMEGFVSRGRLLWDLLDCRERTEVARRLVRVNWRNFKPFTLAALGVGAPARVFRWDGEALRSEEAGGPLISSAFDPIGVSAARRRRFELMARSAGGSNPEMLLAFHRSHAPTPGAYSTCMHRADARTVSFSHIRVSGGEIAFSYQAQAPCERQPLLTVNMKGGRDADY